MDTTQLDLIRNQLEAAARNQASRTSAGLRRDASLVGEAHQIIGRLQRPTGADQVGFSRHSRRERERRRTATIPTPTPPVRPTPDGYIRRTPVQPLYVAADYQKRIVRKILRIAAIGAVLLFLLWLLLSSNLLSQ